MNSSSLLPKVMHSVFFPNCRQPGSYPETGFGSLAFFVDDHTERGAGGREYGTSEKDKQTLTD
jgi:hypothetical protein